MRREALIAGIVTAVTGFAVGAVMGIVPIGIQFNSYLTECSAVTTEAACESLSASCCVWNSTASLCLYPDHATVNCTAFANKDSCQDGAPNGACFFNEKHSKCEHSHGWAPWEQGLFAGCYIIGAVLAAIGGGKLTEFLGRRRSLMLSGVLCLIATAVGAYGWFDGMSLPILCVGQVLAGMVCGFVCITGPMYCGEVAPADVAETVGMLFQVGTTLGILIPAVVGFFLDPSERYHVNSSTQASVPLEQTFQLVFLVDWVAAAALLLTGLFAPESPRWLQSEELNGSSTGEAVDLLTGVNESEGEPDALLTFEAAPENSVSRLYSRANAVPILVAIAMAVNQQLTGINSIMAFAPEITGNMGLRPLLGNLLVMCLNFVATLPAIPASKKWAPDRMYAAATWVASAMCLLTGVAVFPGVISHDTTARNALAIVGILGYTAAFQIGIGPSFFVLAQSIFPKQSRAAGCAFSVWIQYSLNVVVNWGYPVAQTALSGGPSGNQDQGLAICFLVFAFFGFGCAVSLSIGFAKLARSNADT